MRVGRSSLKEYIEMAAPRARCLIFAVEGVVDVDDVKFASIRELIGATSQYFSQFCD